MAFICMLFRWKGIERYALYNGNLCIHAAPRSGTIDELVVLAAEVERTLAAATSSIKLSSATLYKTNNR
jgi:hypothetical protein